MNVNTAILIKGCLENDLQSQEALYRLFYPDMIKVCFRYTNNIDDAGAIYNNAMMKVFKSLSIYKDEGKMEAWVKTIIVNCCLDFCKQQKMFKQSVPYADQNEDAIRPEAFDRLSGKEIQQLIAALPKATATVFNLFIYEGFTHKQIGEQLGISENTSKWHVSEAKKSLRVKLEILTQTELQKNAAG